MESEVIGENRGQDLQKRINNLFVLPATVIIEVQESTVSMTQGELDSLIHELKTQRATGLKAHIKEAIVQEDVDRIARLGERALEQALVGTRLKAARRAVTAIMRHNYYENGPQKKKNNSTIRQKDRMRG